MERRKFTREFKLEAVRLIKERGVSYVNAAPKFPKCAEVKFPSWAGSGDQPA
jgi:transposase-like protein